MSDTDPRDKPQPGRGDDPGAGSRRAAVAGLVLVLVLVVIGYFLMTSLREESKREDCLMSGRTNCAPLDIPPPKQ
jgi:hypothetical protein